MYSTKKYDYYRRTFHSNRLWKWGQSAKSQLGLGINILLSERLPIFILEMVAYEEMRMKEHSHFRETFLEGEL